MTSAVADHRVQTVRDYFDAVDAGDRQKAQKLLSPDLRFRFANLPPQVGVDAPMKAGQTLRSAVSGMVHGVKSVRPDAAGETATAELDMTYHRLDGSDLVVPACVVFAFDKSGRIDEYRIYVDVSELGVHGAEQTHG